MYCHARTGAGTCIVSARSADGLDWDLEDGIRIAQTRTEEDAGAYGPCAGRCDDGWWMAYAGWSSPPAMHGRILAADSADGMTWTKQPEPVLQPGSAADARHCSEPSLLQVDDGSWRMYYEACGSDGAWRILAAGTGRQ